MTKDMATEASDATFPRQAISPEIKIFGWQELRLTKNKLTPEMLSSGGLVKYKLCHLMGENTHTDAPQNRLVMFDKDYVIYQIAAAFAPLIFDRCVNGDESVEVLTDLACEAIHSFFDTCSTTLNANVYEKAVTAEECLKRFKST